METSQVSFSGRADKEEVAMYAVEYYSAIKNDEIPPFGATRMDLWSVMLSETSQTEKDRDHMISLICGL